MQNTPRITQLIGGLALAVVGAAPLAAQQSQLFSWRGVVDEDMRIVMRAGQIQSSVISGSLEATAGRANRFNVLPRREGTVTVQVLEGRGLVQVIEQPSISNGFTAVIQVRDAIVGAAPYSFVTYFDDALTVRRHGRVLESFGGEVSIAAGAPVFRFSGNVDGDLQITLRRGRVGYEVVSGERPRNVTGTMVPGGMPERDASLGLVARSVRGIVSILQQPSAANNYTAVIRVSDTPSGFGYYDFDVIWR
jgi:hypothetical protein